MEGNDVYWCEETGQLVIGPYRPFPWLDTLYYEFNSEGMIISLTLIPEGRLEYIGEL